MVEGSINKEKLYCFVNYFKSLDINIKELNFQEQIYPIKRWKTIVDFMCAKEKEVLVKPNAIYNLVEAVFLRCEALISKDNQEDVKNILLNIASVLYDKRFLNQEENEKFIINTIKWSNNSNLIRELTLFICLYLNASSKVCTLLSDTFLQDKHKIEQFYVNNRVLSKEFISKLTDLEHEQIILAFLNSKRNIPLLNEEFYNYVRNFCDADFDFFLVLFKCTPFFLIPFVDILEIFGYENIKTMSLEELKFICHFKTKPVLLRVKILMDLNVPLAKMEEILAKPSVFELLTLGLPISKIDKVLHYPELVTFITKKIALMKNSNTPLYSSYKALIKVN